MSKINNNAVHYLRKASRINAIGAAFAKDFEPWRIRNGALYISNRGNAHSAHIQVYELKEN